MKPGFPVHVVHGKSGNKQATQRRDRQQRERQGVGDKVKMDLIMAAGEPVAEGDLIGQPSREPRSDQRQRCRQRTGAGGQRNPAGVRFMSFAARLVK